MPALFQTPAMTPALLFGAVFDLLLFGVLTTQVYVYYISFPKDRVFLKAAVIWVYLAGVVQTGLTLVDVRKAFIQWQSLQAIGLGTPYTDHLWLSITAMTSVVAIVIQCSYAHRIYVISHKRWLAIVIICMSLVQFASGILGSICYHEAQAVSTAVELPGFSDLPLGNAPCQIGFTWTWGPVNIMCDLTITSCLVTFLLKHRKTTLRRKTRSHLTNIIRIVVETGMATTILMIVYTVLFWLWVRTVLVFSDTFHPLPGLMTSKVYSNSMLALLNNRATIGYGRNAVESFEFVEVSTGGRMRDMEWRTASRSSPAIGEA